MPKKIAVVYGHGSASPTDVVTAAEGYADLLFVCDTSSAHVRDVMDLLDGYVEMCATDSSSQDPGLPAALAAHRVDGVVTFSDAAMRLAARVAGIVGTPFHSPDTAVLLTDKFPQREALRRAGVAVPRFVSLGRDTDPVAAAAEVGYPCVLKPRVSNGSRFTYALADEHDLAEALAATAEVPAEYGGFVLEEMLRGDPSVAGPEWGDYVSVESVALHASITHTGVIGRLPLTAPFRETGIFHPSTLRDKDLDAVVQEAEAALRAVGIADGLCHTELKLTPDGPRVIEVNGRLGGETAKVMRAASGADLVKMALYTSVGDVDAVHAELAKLRQSRPGISHQISAFSQESGVLDALEGLETVRAMAGVRRAVPCKRGGERVDVTMGTFSEIASVYGIADDHEHLRRILHSVQRLVQPRWRSTVRSSASERLSRHA